MEFNELKGDLSSMFLYELCSDSGRKITHSKMSLKPIRGFSAYKK
jgi:hypothetical protein